MELQELEVDGRPDPLGTATSGLRLTWRFSPADGTALRQTWWSVLVRTPGAVVWDSGRVAAPHPWTTTPDDVQFAPWTEHTWELRVGTDTGTELRATGRFTPAPIADPDWDGARWIGRAPVPSAGDDPRLPSERCRDGSLAAPILSVTIPPSSVPIARALLALAVGGHADVRVDGVLVADEVLAPTTTHWDRRVQVVLADCTAALADGAAHELSLELGRGFAGMTNANVWSWERAPWHAEPSVRAVLRIERTDGTTESWPTGPDWSMQAGPTLLDDLYGGEIVDLRRRRGGALEARRQPATLVTGPTGGLEARREQPIRVTDTAAPVDIRAAGTTTWVIAFPRVIAGWVRLRLPAGGAGTTVTVRYGERLRPDGLPNADDEKHYFADRFQTDEIVLDGTATTWEPRFSYKGFRYVSVTGWPHPDGPGESDVLACTVRSDAARVSTFTVDDPLLQWTHDATVATMENNLHGYPTDTPKYEKNGWTGDAAVGAEMFLTNLDAAPVLRKWIADLAETVRPGHPPDLIAPNAGVFGVDALAPVWHSALVTVPMDVYRHTGDRDLLARHVDVIEQYARFELDRSPGGIADTILGDWVAPGTDPGGGNPPEDSRIPATAFLVRILDTTAAIDRELGRDPSEFADAARRVRSAFRTAFVVDEPGPDGALVTGPGDDGFRQSHHVLALAFDLVPDPADRTRIADALAADVLRRGDHLDTGAIGTKWLLPVLTATGHAERAAAVARQTSVPSWGAWWAAGATSTFEHWDLAARSHGHYFLGTVDDWLTGDVAGLRPTGPGWSTFRVAPAMTAFVGSASCSVRTPYGVAAVAWRHGDEGAVLVDVIVPFGTRATVVLPDGTSHDVGPGVHAFVGPACS
jgi:alpha-L-rhamnosidase